MAEPLAAKVRSKHSWCWSHFSMDEGSTTHAICQLAGPTGAPCHAPITATSDKLKQHLMTQVHGMNKLKSAAFWQARQDEAAASWHRQRRFQEDKRDCRLLRCRAVP
jgi:hypothetical protein